MFFFFFFKYQPRVNKTRRNLGKLYVEYNYMTKDQKKIMEKTCRFFFKFKKNSQLFPTEK